MIEPRPRRPWARGWPWAVLALAIVLAVWHVVDYPDDRDPEFPQVARPTFSRFPPPAYRLAEPGDTLDRVGLYFAAAALVLSAAGWLVTRRRDALPASRGARDHEGWLAALALSLAAAWHAANPGPTFDGWHGLGWRALLDAATPWPWRLTLAIAAMALLMMVARAAWAYRSCWCQPSDRPLLAVALALVASRQIDAPGLGPPGYWPRWAFLWGMLAFVLALLRALPPIGPRPRRLAIMAAGLVAWLGLVGGGLTLIWYHRPLERLRTVVPGRIYISAMPTYPGLQVAHARHRFKTIINLFPEDTPQRSPYAPDEQRFVREQGIRYVGSTGAASDSEAFLDHTLALAQDPDAWPILVHCHGCMDRTPAWMGIYRFVVQGRPLDAIFREIEAHRGYRPKASVTLLYNRVLPPRAPGRYSLDPTARLLRECAAGTVDPFVLANPSEPPRVSRRDEPVRRP